MKRRRREKIRPRYLIRDEGAEIVGELVQRIRENKRLRAKKLKSNRFNRKIKDAEKTKRGGWRMKWREKRRE